MMSLSVDLNNGGDASEVTKATNIVDDHPMANWTLFPCGANATEEGLVVDPSAWPNDQQMCGNWVVGYGSTRSQQLQHPEFEHISLFLLLLSFCLATVVGNILVVLAVLRERSLHTATNYFITSLAVADCLVGLVVMPFSAAYEAMDQQWVFGPDLCDAWHSLDVLASTASILNLCVISLDRYWAITDPMSYPFRMSNTRASLLILLVWVCSSAISFPAIAWWRATATGPPPPWQCPFTEDTGYLVFSSIVSFYGPLAVMVFTYFRIYRAALKHTKSLKSGCKVVGQNGEMTIRIHKGGGGASTAAAGAAVAVVASQGGQLLKKGHSPPSDSFKPHDMENSAMAITNGFKNLIVTNQKKNFFSKKISQFAKEKKAAKTLGTVMGVFIICWLPFFLTNVISGICLDCIPAIVFQVVNWLGWINSSMNPVIYACFSRDFRRAFASIICCCCCHTRKNSRGNSNRSFGHSGDDELSHSKVTNFRNLNDFLRRSCCTCSRRAKTNHPITGSIPTEEILPKDSSKSSNALQQHSNHHVSPIPLERLLSDEAAAPSLRQNSKSLSFQSPSPAKSCPRHRASSCRTRSKASRPVIYTFHNDVWWMEPYQGQSRPNSISRNPLLGLDPSRSTLSFARNSLYSIPPPNFNPQQSSEKLV
ncbi:dopamine receptor 2-like [Tigriopus californicus]|nr:dopamine receptor 2-like [Tigriopus californicus]